MGIRLGQEHAPELRFLQSRLFRKTWRVAALGHSLPPAVASTSDCFGSIAEIQTKALRASGGRAADASA